MGEVVTVGLDIAKSVFQVHGVDGQGQVVVSRRLKRRQILEFFGGLERVLIGVEACGSAYFWARELSKLGHEVKLMPPAYVRPYVKRQKNDAADAEAICEAVTRPHMRFVPVKTEEQQTACMLHRTRSLLVKQRTMLLNAVRAHLAELAIAVGAGVAQALRMVETLQSGEDLGLAVPARAALAGLSCTVVQIQAQVAELGGQIRRWHYTNDMSNLLETVPGIGVLTASALTSMVSDPKAFGSGRHFAAWLGLAPRQNSSGGKARLGRITKAGTPYLRRMLALGATAVLRFIREGRTPGSPWARRLLERRPPKVAAVAMANKMARIAWAVMTTGTEYEPPAEIASA